MKLKLGFIILIVIGCLVNAAFSQYFTSDWKMHNVGKVRQYINNLGKQDDSGILYTTYRGLLWCEMPVGSNEEHIFQAGIWIGGITPQGDTLVSVTRTHFTPEEFFPSAEPWDTIWVVSKGDTVNIGDPADPYWPGYVGVSDQDFVCRYSDYNITNIENHVPMYLDIIQRSYAWSSQPLDEFLIYKYDIMPKQIDLHRVFVGFWIHGEIGNNDVGDNFLDELTLFYPEELMIIGEDNPGGNDGTAISPIGIKILEPSDTTLLWTYKWYDHEDLSGFGRDPFFYKVGMSTGEIMPERPEVERFHISLCFGPYESVVVGDTIHVEMAHIFGYGREGLLENADYLEFLKGKDYRVPSPPPKPPLRITLGNKKVDLTWEPDDNNNPETYQDPNRGDGETQPFEGYRLYKSSVSASGPWTMLGEFDLPDNEYGPNTGLEYEYSDVGLLNNFEYYYSITSYSKPDSVTAFPSQESSVTSNAKVVIPGTPPPPTVGEVAVVPNPYRGDIAYHEFNPPWEKPEGDRQFWMEQDRRIQFINLPDNCEIKIYTLAGDLVDSIIHSNPEKGFEDWNLTSSIGQAIASGIYLFTVEDRRDGKVQVGKFVIIK